MENMETKPQNSFSPATIAIVAGVVVAVVAVVYFILTKPDSTSPQIQEDAGDEMATMPETDPRLRLLSDSEERLFVLEEPKMDEDLGGYADPSIVEAGPDEYLMYLNRFGSAFEHDDQGIFVLESSDMLNWTEKTSIIFQGIAVGRAVKMDEGVRFYYPTTAPLGPNDPPSVLRSAFSLDGVSFTDEPGARLEPSPGNYMEGATVVKLDDGLWHMYFTESRVEESWQHQSPAIYRATSEDGIVWEREDTPVLEVEREVEGLMPWSQILRPFVIERRGGGYWMFYNSHSRIYYAYSEDGITWKKLGQLISDGADTDAIYDKDGNLRLYFGRRTQAEGSMTYTVLVEEY